VPRIASPNLVKVSSVAFTHNGEELLFGDLIEITVQTLATGLSRAGPVAEYGNPEFARCPDGDQLLVAEFDLKIMSIDLLSFWMMLGDRNYQQLWKDGPYQWKVFKTPAVGPSAKRVAVSVREGHDHPRQSIQVRDGGTGKVLHDIPHDAADPVQQLVFTADGTKLLARFLDHTVKVFDVATGQPAGELVHPRRSFVTGLAVHPDGKAIATSRNDGKVWFWDPMTFRPLTTFDWKLGKLVSVAFAPDGSIAAAGTEDGQVVVWDVDL
jgi:WD40 repeat protein